MSVNALTLVQAQSFENDSGAKPACAGWQKSTQVDVVMGLAMAMIVSTSFACTL